MEKKNDIRTKRKERLKVGLTGITACVIGIIVCWNDASFAKTVLFFLLCIAIAATAVDQVLSMLEEKQATAKDDPPQQGMKSIPIPYNMEEVRIASPIDGEIIYIKAEPGDTVDARQDILIVERMKGEWPVTAPCTGVVASIRVHYGDYVRRGDIVATMYRPMKGVQA